MRDYSVLQKHALRFHMLHKTGSSEASVRASVPLTAQPRSHNSETSDNTIDSDRSCLVPAATDRIHSHMRQVRACPSAPTPSQSWPRRPGIGWHSSFTFASQRRWPYINQTRRLPPRDRLAPHAGLNFDSVIKQEPSRRALPPFSSIILHYLGLNYCNKTATYSRPAIQWFAVDAPRGSIDGTEAC